MQFEPAKETFVERPKVANEGPKRTEFELMEEEMMGDDGEIDMEKLR
jgi:hypothetical protein